MAKRFAVFRDGLRQLAVSAIPRKNESDGWHGNQERNNATMVTAWQMNRPFEQEPGQTKQKQHTVIDG